MRTGALHRSVLTPPTRTTSRERHGVSGAGAARHDPAANQDDAAPAQGRHDVEAFGGTAEPTLVDVLNEPIVRTIMRRDGVALSALQRVMGDARLMADNTPGRETSATPARRR